ncbi:MAG: signal recognition particle protein, partial [Thermoguttaceae bacterium]|nr:signal recognition particle protein [Thermoguttaceae bacterium]
KPAILDSRRKRRVAAGSGVTLQQVNELLNMHEQMARMVKSWSTMGSGERMRTLQGMTQQASNPSSLFGGLARKKGSTGKRLTPKERQEQRKRLEKERRNKKKKR